MPAQLCRRLITVFSLSCALKTLAHEPERFFFEHPSPEGSETRRFEARIDRPDDSNGFAVMLIGGGSVTDMDWFVPASYDNNGKSVPVTMSGKPTRDAKTIGDALVDAGFTVMRFSSVHADDELANETPGMAMGIPFPYSVELTRSARDAFRARAPESLDRLILVGHSLGAPRATAVADDGVVGLVCLAGAYVSRTDASVLSSSAEAAKAIEPYDSDDDGVLAGAEIEQAEADEELHSAIIDHDNDGVIHAWEVAASWRLDGRSPDSDSAKFREGIPWFSDVVRDRRIPALMIFGGLDTISIHGPWLESHAKTHELDITVEYFPELGHNLSEEREDLIDSIDPGVVDQIVVWSVSRPRTPTP